jgi:FdhD protein
MNAPRNIAAASACGLCGRVTIESLRADARPPAASWTLAPEVVAAAPARLRAVQRAFDESGGLHAAGLFDRSGALLASAEDVGRHNAVDKVVGRMLLERRLPLADAFLFVSGRASFEIVQKALLAGVPLVGAVSAPSSLAIELAAEMNMTLLGFVREGAFNIYTHAERIDAGRPAGVEVRPA